jgi:hypothetical protein
MVAVLSREILGEDKSCGAVRTEPAREARPQDTIGSFQNLFSSAPLLEGMANYNGAENGPVSLFAEKL